jgi:hypothetical protein
MSKLTGPRHPSQHTSNGSPRFQVIQVHDPAGSSDLTTKLAQLTLSPATSAQKSFPGSGHFRQFISTAEGDRYSRREVVGIVMFAAEGDNSGDAQDLAGLVCKSLGIEVKEWKTPRSWEGLFGETVRRGAEEGLYW